MRRSTAQSNEINETRLSREVENQIAKKMNQITSAQMPLKSENVDDFNLHNEEYDPYIIVILNQL